MQLPSLGKHRLVRSRLRVGIKGSAGVKASIIIGGAILALAGSIGRFSWVPSQLEGQARCVLVRDLVLGNFVSRSSSGAETVQLVLFHGGR